MRVDAGESFGACRTRTRGTLVADPDDRFPRAAEPTSCCFGGESIDPERQLFVTSCSLDTTVDADAKDDVRG